jgi:hypothetical protein
MKTRVESWRSSNGTILMAIGPKNGHPGVVVVYNGKTLVAEKVYHTGSMGHTSNRFKKLKQEMENDCTDN